MKGKLNAEILLTAAYETGTLGYTHHLRLRITVRCKSLNSPSSPENKVKLTQQSYLCCHIP